MAIINKSMRAESRKDYTTRAEEKDGICLEQLRTGALLRIADAVEVMAKRHVELIAEVDRLKAAHDYVLTANASWAKRCAALKGQITKLKRRTEWARSRT
jgi:hypothetical protein